MRITKEPFGQLQGTNVNAYTLMNNQGFQVTALDYGCIITKIIAPDKDGNLENVVLGFDSLGEYQEHSPYFGAVIGRVAGRINKGEFELNGKSYTLPQNDGKNHLHGGNVGFDKVIWNTQIIEREDEVGLKFNYRSPDGEEGYPGTVDMKVTYLLNNENELTISYDGVSDQDTLLNVTNHTYFNLSGDLKTTITDHVLTMKSHQYLALGDDLIPTGEMVDVENTVFDFQNGREIVDGIESRHRQNRLASNGYDHPFLLDENYNKEIQLKDRTSGRSLIIETNEPCVVLYTGNMIGSNYKIRGVNASNYLGLCLETQGLPDAINHPHFPTVILKQGETYSRSTKYTFLA
ncbi:aldose epimerase family protein [Halalkalibacter kiskunsagensis]|uniref:Aldose 1-epimerase n=1 Tax=Halalkalibacter kiskunsagensis TaxID=1548599 RepID=A0ABV6KJ17_9BACI